MGAASGAAQAPGRQVLKTGCGKPRAGQSFSGRESRRNTAGGGVPLYTEAGARGRRQVDGAVRLHAQAAGNSSSLRSQREPQGPRDPKQMTTNAGAYGCRIVTAVEGHQQSPTHHAGAELQANTINAQQAVRWRPHRRRMFLNTHHHLTVTTHRPPDRKKNRTTQLLQGQSRSRGPTCTATSSWHCPPRGHDSPPGLQRCRPRGLPSPQIPLLLRHSCTLCGSAATARWNRTAPARVGRCRGLGITCSAA